MTRVAKFAVALPLMLCIVASVHAQEKEKNHGGRQDPGLKSIPPEPQDARRQQDNQRALNRHRRAMREFDQGPGSSYTAEFRENLPMA